MLVSTPLCAANRFCSGFPVRGGIIINHNYNNYIFLTVVRYLTVNKVLAYM